MKNFLFLTLAPFYYRLFPVFIGNGSPPAENRNPKQLFSSDFLFCSSLRFWLAEKNGRPAADLLKNARKKQNSY